MADLVTSESRRYLHGIQNTIISDDDTGVALNVIPANNQLALLESATVTGTLTVYGDFIVSGLAGGAAYSTFPASDVTVVPTGSISSTNAQAALAELDAEKAQLAGTLTNQRVPFANASGFLTDNANLFYVAGTGLRVTDATASSSTTTGALVVTGGIATGGGMYAGGTVRFTNSTASTSTSTGTLVVTGGVGIGGAIYSGGACRFTNSTASTSTTTGALVVTGGVGVGGALYVGGLINSASTITGSSFSGAGTGLTGDASNLNAGSSGCAKTASCIGDGITRVFLWDGNPVYRTDWQGKQLLYTTSRKNLCLRSQEFENATWVRYSSGTATAPIATANAGIAPDGTPTADRVTFNRGAGVSASDICTIAQTNIAVTIGQRYSLSIWLKSNTGANQQVMIYWLGLATGAGGGVITNVVTVTPQWQRFTISELSAKSTIGIQVGCRVTIGDAALDLLMWGAQVELSPAPTSYIATTTSSASVTDYSASGSIVTLASAPLAGALLHGLDSAPTILPGAYTVASLPTAITASHRAYVTDANATTFASIVAGGGSNGVPVYYDGTNWRIG